MRHRTDANHAGIMEVVRGVGVSIHSTSMVGDGFPDAVVGLPLPCPFCRNRFPQNLLWQIKDGNKSKSRQALTPAEVKFHDEWRGQLAIVPSMDEALKMIGALKRKSFGRGSQA